MTKFDMRFEKILKLYQYILCCPTVLQQQPKRHFICIYIILIIYWCGLITTAVFNVENQSQVSYTVNIIQFLSNAVHFSTILLFPINKYTFWSNLKNTLQRIQYVIDRISKNHCYKTKRVYLEHCLFYGCIIYVLLFLVFDFLSYCIVEKGSVCYWIFIVIPSLVTPFMTLKIFSILKLIEEYFQIINDQMHRTCIDNLSPVKYQESDVFTVVELKIDRCTLLKSLNLSIRELCETISTLNCFGWVFLTIFINCFLSTCIQSYYFYLLILVIYNNINPGYTVLFGIVVLTVFTNLSQIFLITNAAENIKKKVNVSLLFFYYFNESNMSFSFLQARKTSAILSKANRKVYQQYV